MYKQRYTLDNMADQDFICVHGLRIVRSCSDIERYYIERNSSGIPSRDGGILHYLTREDVVAIMSAKGLNNDILVIAAAGLGINMVDAIMLALDYETR